MPLITPQQAVDHLKLSDGDYDPQDLVSKIALATGLVLTYLERTEESGWTPETDPDQDFEFACVQAAIYKVLGNLYRFRGDDEKASDPLSADVIRILSLLRDPALS